MSRVIEETKCIVFFSAISFDSKPECLYEQTN